MTDPFLSRVPAGLGGRVLDTSALIDLSLGRTVYAQTFARRAAALGLTWAVPTTAVAEAWARLSDKGRLGLSVLVQLGHTVVEPLDVHRAGPVGEAVRRPVPASTCAPPTSSRSPLAGAGRC